MTTPTKQTPVGTPGDGPRLKQPALLSGTLPRFFPPVLLVVLAAVAGLALSALGTFNVPLFAVVTFLAYMVAITVAASIVENGRKAKDRLVTAVVYACFGLAMVPLVSLLWTVVVKGLVRLDGYFLSVSMNGVIPSMDAGGVYHAIVGTVFITGFAALISIPIGLMTAIYLVEYGRGRLKQAITFFVDVMTGIPSIVAGLFVVALWIMFFGPGNTNGAAGAIALSVLMIPVVVRSCEEMLKLVPSELREASYALGVPKWLTIVKVVLPTAIAGITTGIMLALARVIGETAPLILTAGTSAVAINWNLFNGQMMSLPVFIYAQVRMGGAVNYERAWAAALTLIIIVMLLFLVARLVSRFFAPKLGR
ncbi:phosphate transport system permease protein [Spinactinospora alkalitolerans]|uniref:Phosphate transport system permease protein PstA n=1 Tax=Spinactinospora alkalitolerans TaxID=687207 RepID=A0A852TMA2_9ACTN|nr:phosphate ABC transporter permease PstA [Spinactinospora alkalitolerans]NYE45079.1 phosphate transport system permease protein [Spinactinospora alkalitolerans]